MSKSKNQFMRVANRFSNSTFAILLPLIYFCFKHNLKYHKNVNPQWFDCSKFLSIFNYLYKERSRTNGVIKSLLTTEHKKIRERNKFKFNDIEMRNSI